MPRDSIESIANYESGEEDELPEVFFQRTSVNFNLCKVNNFYSVFRSIAFTKPVALGYWKERYDDLKFGEM